MSLRSMENITKQSWDMIPMPDTVIDRVDILVKHQQEMLLFTDSRGQIFGYGDVDITGVDVYGDENEVPLKTESANDLEYQEEKEELHPDQ